MNINLTHGESEAQIYWEMMGLGTEINNKTPHAAESELQRIPIIEKGMILTLWTHVCLSQYGSIVATWVHSGHINHYDRFVVTPPRT